MRSEMRVNRIDGKDVYEYRWICECGLEGEWREVRGSAVSYWEDDVSDEHEQKRQEREAARLAKLAHN